MISTTAQYALSAVVYLATRTDQYAGRIAIAEATLVPVDYLLKVLGELNNAGIVESKRGPGGGYRLINKPADISALDVVLAVDKIPRITKCPLGFADHTQLCPLHQLLDDASRRVEEAFAETTIEDLIPQQKQKTGQPQKTNVRIPQQKKLTVHGSIQITLVFVISLTAVFSSYLMFRSGPPKPTPTADKSSAPPASEAKKFPVTISQPTGPPTVDTGIVDAHGNAVTVSCNTCHATRKPNHDNKTVADLNEFHNGLPFSHGTISCLSCHNSEDYSALKLADGSRVEFTDVMTLCAQCHGPQMRDYQHGVHGGMNGYWDLTRGPRTKNNCIDCHNPHSPQFPKMQPTFKPQDRFLEPVEH